MPRQEFGDFLNDAGPSTPRGRGRGGFGGGRGRGGIGSDRGRGGGRGGGGRGGVSFGRGGGRTVRGGHFGADYSAVPLDYERVNTSRYTRHDDVSVQPFGPPKPRRAFAPHGRPQESSDSTPATPGSGTRTPIGSGLGFHIHGARGAARVARDGSITWGGYKGVPLFVKAGELFKDGEVDVVKADGDTFVVEHYPLSDPSAPQMTQLDDEVEVELHSGSLEAVLEAVAASHRPRSPQDSPEQESEEEPEEEEDTEALEDRADASDVEIVLSERLESQMVVTEQTVVVAEEAEVIMAVPAPDIGASRAAEESGPEAEDAVVSESQDDDPFFVDTAGEPAGDDLFFVDETGDASTSTPSYERATAKPLGADIVRPPTDLEEDIVYRPRIITEHVHAVPSSAPSQAGPSHQVFVDPRVAFTRKQRKWARNAEGVRRRRGNKRAQFRNTLDDGGSDLDWGSDGPPKVRGVVDATPPDSASSRDSDEDADPEISLEDTARFVGGMDKIRGDNDAMAYMDSGSDEYDEIDEDVKGRMKQSQADPYAPNASSSEDDDESIDSDDFEAIAAAYDSAQFDDSFSSEGEAKMFTGGSNWKDEDEHEWFVKNMEDALDGGAMTKSRRERNAVFRAVATGSFDADALPTEPFKKDKKGKHIPSELQEQWARDRAKKAARKQEREIARVLAALDPHPATHGKKGKGKKKLSGKAAAATLAHLIPASAAEIAEMFDSDNDDGGWGIDPRRGRALLLPQSLDDIDKQVTTFMADPGKTTLALPAMDKEQRKKVHMLAECYDLKSKSKGKGNMRHPILIKLARSGLRDDKRPQLERILAASVHTGGRFYKALYTKPKGPRAPRGTGASVRAKDGDLVGEGAEKIGESNVGHKLLSMMGWTEGVSIGRAGGGGLEAPIIAVVKNTKTGLGA